MSEEKRPMGRPSKYKPEYCEQLIEHMASGLSFESFAGELQISKQVLYDWEKVHPEFLYAKEIAFNRNRTFWEKIGIEHIINKSDSESLGDGVSSSKSRSLNASVWIFNMKNRFKWRDRQPDETDVVVNNLSQANDDELQKLLDEKLKELGK